MDNLSQNTKPTSAGDVLDKIKFIAQTEPEKLYDTMHYLVALGHTVRDFSSCINVLDYLGQPGVCCASTKNLENSVFALNAVTSFLDDHSFLDLKKEQWQRNLKELLTVLNQVLLTCQNIKDAVITSKNKDIILARKKTLRLIDDMQLNVFICFIHSAQAPNFGPALFDFVIHKEMDQDKKDCLDLMQTVCINYRDTRYESYDDFQSHNRLALNLWAQLKGCNNWSKASMGHLIKYHFSQFISNSQNKNLSLIKLIHKSLNFPQGNVDLKKSCQQMIWQVFSGEIINFYNSPDSKILSNKEMEEIAQKLKDVIFADIIASQKLSKSIDDKLSLITPLEGLASYVWPASQGSEGAIYAQNPHLCNLVQKIINSLDERQKELNLHQWEHVLLSLSSNEAKVSNKATFKL